MHIKEGDEWKGVFVTSIGSYEPIMMFFGMYNSPSTFQQMMNDMFSNEMHKGFLMIYMDDLMIFTCVPKVEHVKLVKHILQKLQENDLFIKPSKCIFFAKSVDFLGMTMSEDGVSMDPAKVSAINDYQVPHDVKDIQHFLDMANFYCHFIPEFASIVKPLMDLTKKECVSYS